MELNFILESTLQKFERQFADVPRFVPNLLRFHKGVNICKGVYDDGKLVGTFVLQPYCEAQGYKASMLYAIPILRIERPLVDITLGERRRLEVFKEIKDHVLRVAKLNSYDFVEMELYDRINDEIFFPSSLSTVGSFNLAGDYGYLKDDSFEEIKKTVCFEIFSDREALHVDWGKHGIIGRLDRMLNRWSSVRHRLSTTHRRFYIYESKIISSHRVVVTALNPTFSLPFNAFNLPEYVFIRQGLKPATIQCYPDLFLLSKDNWRPLVGSTEEERRRSMDRGKIYRVSGLNGKDLLASIGEIRKKGPLSGMTRLQIFSDERSQDVIHEAGGRMVHTLTLLRTSLH